MRPAETKQKGYIDLYINPDVSRYGLMAWASFDDIAEKGYEHGREVIARLTNDELATFRG